MKKHKASRFLIIVLIGAAVISGCGPKEEPVDDVAADEVEFVPEIPPTPEDLGTFSIHVCMNIAEGIAGNLGFVHKSVEAPFEDVVTGFKGDGCETTYDVASSAYESAEEIHQVVRSSLGMRGWRKGEQWDREDGGVLHAGYRNNMSLCLVSVAPESGGFYPVTMNCIDDESGNVFPEYPWGSLTPLSPDECAGIQGALDEIATYPDPSIVENVPYEDFITGETGVGCRISAIGGLEGGPSGEVLFDGMVDAMTSMGWEENPDVGPTAGAGYFATGFEQDGKQCKLLVTWRVFDPVCPADTPFSACDAPLNLFGVGTTLHCAQE